jgi:nucleoside-diphosphate-sugar epimerase
MSNLKRILVTGANGFIGGRVLERAIMLRAFDVCASVHTWSGAARVGRLGCAVRACDVTDERQIDEALEGVQAVVHCTAGPRDVVLAGTRNLLSAALRKGIERVVYFSTCDVYGQTQGEVNEEHPLQASGKAYAGTKREAEELCWEYVRKGLPLVILRPTIVYGPFSKSWSIRYATRISAGKWGTLGSSGEGTCNLIYVDDLAMAALKAVNHSGVAGQAFNINGDDTPTWNSYWEQFNAAMGRSTLRSMDPRWTMVKSRVLHPARLVAQSLLKRFRKQIFGIYAKNYAARGAMQAAESTFSLTPMPDELALYQRKVHFANDKAKRLLGFAPRVRVPQGLEYTVAWLRHHGYLPEAVTLALSP